MKRYHLVTNAPKLGWQSNVGFDRVGFDRDGRMEFECWSEIDASDKRFPCYLIRRTSTGETRSAHFEIKPQSNRTWRTRLRDFFLMRAPQTDLVFQQGQAEQFRLRRGPSLLTASETLLTRNVEVPLQQEQQTSGWMRIAVRRFFAFHVWTCRPSALMIFSDDDDWTWIAITIAYFKWTRLSNSG